MSFMNNVLSKTSMGALVVSAAVMAFSGSDAKAAVVHMDPSFSDVATTGTGTTGPFNVSVPNIYRFENQSGFGGSDSSGALFGFEFTANSLPQPVNTTVTLNLQGEFSGFEAVWSDDTTMDAGDTVLSLVSSGSLGTIDQSFSFTSVPQYLLVKYDSVDTGGVLDLRVQAVPLPAAGIMLLTALGGLGGAAGLRRRRRKTA